MTTIEHNAGLSGRGANTMHGSEARGRLTPVASSVLACVLLTACAGARYHQDGMVASRPWSL